MKPLLQAAIFLDKLKREAYSGLAFKVSLVIHLKKCAEDCKRGQLDDTQTLLTWTMRELEWLYCAGLCMTKCPHEAVDPKPIYRLFQLLAEHRQHKLIVMDFLTGLFPLR